MELRDHIRTIPDFPVPGIRFRDITPLIGNAGALTESVRLMTRHDLSEIDLIEGDQRIRLRRGPRPTTASQSVVTPANPATAATPAAVEPTPAPSGDSARAVLPFVITR